MEQKTILFAVLNWGLGHASRSIPLIRELSNDPKIRLIIVADGDAYQLLSSEFPDLICEKVQDVSVHYKSGKLLPFRLLLTGIQLHKVNIKEHKIVDSLLKKYDVRVLISDNRYGFWHPKTYNIMITHQLTILPPPFFKFVIGAFRQFIKSKIRSFNEVWIPDFEENGGLAGALSHQINAHKNIKFIGLLSRYYLVAVNSEDRKKIVAIISGPMPFRKILADSVVLFAEQNKIELDVYYNNIPGLESGNWVKLHSNCSFSELNYALNSADIIVGSGGYTTIMDVISLNKKAILIPTPGQTEQRYLALRNQNQHHLYFLEMKELLLLRSKVSELAEKEKSNMISDQQKYKAIITQVKKQLFDNS